MALPPGGRGGSRSARRSGSHVAERGRVVQVAACDLVPFARPEADVQGAGATDWDGLWDGAGMALPGRARRMQRRDGGPD